jgi:hypothetical protein
MNWDDPAERFALIRGVGVAEYQRLLKEYGDASTPSLVLRPSVAARSSMPFIVLPFPVPSTAPPLSNDASRFRGCR